MLNEPDQARSTYTSEQMEDCDIENEEDVKLYVIDTEDESIKLEVIFSPYFHTFLDVNALPSSSTNHLFWA